MSNEIERDIQSKEGQELGEEFRTVLMPITCKGIKSVISPHPVWGDFRSQEYTYLMLRLEAGKLLISCSTHDEKYDNWYGSNPELIGDDYPKNIFGIGKVKIECPHDPPGTQWKRGQFVGDYDEHRNQESWERFVQNNLDNWSADLVHSLIKSMRTVT